MPNEPAPRAPVVPLGAPIARRELRTAAGDPVVVLVGAPVHVGEGWDWACPFRIEGLGDGGAVDAQVHGIDALQALQLVTPAVRGALERAGVSLRWLGSDFWEAGFPRPVEALGVRELEAELHAQLDAATARWLAREVGRRGGAAPSRRASVDRDGAVASLVAVLEEAAELVAGPASAFLWSTWDDEHEARAEIRGLIDALGGDDLPDRTGYAVLFAPTGPLQEVAVGNGRGAAFLALAERFDRAEVALWGGDAPPAGAVPEDAFGCPSCWPASPEAAWAARGTLARGPSPIDDPHLVATLLRCRACGQDFLSLFAERVDWSRGEDPQAWTVLPLTPDEAARLAAEGRPDDATIDALARGRRSLRREHPSDGPVRLAWGSGIRVDEHD